MTIVQASKNLSEQLSNIYQSREAENITNLVMEKISGLTKTERLINKELSLTVIQQQKLQDITNQLLLHKPVQYVLNEAWFYGLKLYVDENVLIPRPETEELVQKIIEDVSDKNVSILDIGTGSGCIAISLKKKLPHAHVYALDISDKSLKISEKNAINNKVEIVFIQADILNFKPGNTLPLLDIIVSNPPYIKKAEAKNMSLNVLLHEPHHALFVPDHDPLIFYKAIADFGVKNLKPQIGKIFVEINEIMGKAVAALFEAKSFSKISIKKDMEGKERIVTAILE